MNVLSQIFHVSLCASYTKYSDEILYTIMYQSRKMHELHCKSMLSCTDCKLCEIISLIKDIKCYNNLKIWFLVIDGTSISSLFYQSVCLIFYVTDSFTSISTREHEKKPSYHVHVYDTLKSNLQQSLSQKLLVIIVFHFQHHDIYESHLLTSNMPIIIAQKCIMGFRNVMFQLANCINIAAWVNTLLEATYKIQWCM